MITFVEADDWIAVYHDNRLLFQDHSIEPERLLTLLGIEHETTLAQDQADREGQFPSRLEDVVADVF
jgi:hypothetical protein